MPGWWFTIESTTTRHFIQQFKLAIEHALSSKADVRAIMRARATKQRFPVSQWVEDLEKLQSSAIEISHKQATKEKRPTFVSPNTPTILETPGVLRALQPRGIPSKRPRSELVQATAQSRPLGTIAETRPRSEKISPASDQRRNLSSLSERQLLTRAAPGLGSKIGPGSRRKVPPALILDQAAKSSTRNDVSAVRRESEGEPKDDSLRLTFPRSPSSPNLSTGYFVSEQGKSESSEKLHRRRSLALPQLQKNDRKAVRLLGKQISASRASALSTPKHSPSSPDGSSSQPPLTPRTPVTPKSAYYTPPVTPTPPQSRRSAVRVSFQPSSTAATSVSGDNSVSEDNTASAATSVSANISGTVPPKNAAKANIIHTPHAVDSFPSLGPHYFPHGGIPILSTSDVRGEKPDNALQDVTPFFSDPDRKYESKFQEKIKGLNGKNSETVLCIEEFLLHSEKAWFSKLRAAEMSRAVEARASKQQRKTGEDQSRADEFGLGKKHKPPTGLKRILRMKIGDWPVYSFLLAFVRNPPPALD